MTLQNNTISKDSKLNKASSLFYKISIPFIKGVTHSWRLYIMLILPVTYIILFRYLPMVGAQIAFRNYKFTEGIWGSEFVGLKHFIRFFNSYDCFKIISNTLVLSFYQLLAGFPFAILLALLLKYCRFNKFKKSVQMVTYLPYFISVVVMVGMIYQFFAPRTGMVNKLIETFGGQSINFMGRSDMFRSLFVWTGVWQTTGYSSIIYIATLEGINPYLHEAAVVDGANKWQRIWYIDIPGILPTAIIMLIMSMGQVMNVAFQKVYLMQTPLNIQTSEVLATYVYKIGLESDAINFSYPAAIGLFVSVVSLILVISANYLSKRLTENSLW